MRMAELPINADKGARLQSLAEHSSGGRGGGVVAGGSVLPPIRQGVKAIGGAKETRSEILGEKDTGLGSSPTGPALSLKG